MKTTRTEQRRSGRASRYAAALLAGVCVALTGCGAGSVLRSTDATAAGGAFKVSGTVYGGALPIGGATVYLYAANQTAYGNASRLVTQTTTSSTAGSGYGTFSLAGSASSCAAGDLVYVVSVGGNTGAGTNANTSLIAALGSCAAAPANYAHFRVNESSTVAAVWSLAAFMTDYQHVSTSATNVAGLTEAFATAAQLVDITTGNAPGLSLPAGTAIPQTTIYTIADILAACVNSSGGTAGSNTNCGTLFTNANAGTAPADTVKAALIMAQNPALTTTKLQNLYGLVPATSPPYQPTLVATPNDLTLAITYAPSTLNAPSALAIDGSGQVWMTNTGGAGSVTVISNAGVVNTGITGAGTGLNVPSAIAIDASGNAWIANKAGNTVTELNSSGAAVTGSPFGGGGLNVPTGIAIDNQGSAWVSNAATNAVTKIAGTTVTEFAPAGVSGPVAIGVNPH